MNHFTKYSLHSCLTILKLPSCFPLPCTWLSHAQTTTEAPLPCGVFRAFAQSLSASPCRQSPFSSLSNLAWQIVGCDVHHYPFYDGYVSVNSLPNISFNKWGYCETTYVTAFRCHLYVGHMAIVQPIRLHPHIHRFPLQFSRSLAVGWLIASPTCYTPRPVSFSDKSVWDRFYMEY